MRKNIIFILSFIFFTGCAGAHYQVLPGAPLMEKGSQRIAVNLSVSIGQEKKLKWYIPRDWIISNEYRYGVGNNTDIGIYPAGLNIIPCALDVRWLDKKESDKLNFHRMEFFYNSITYNKQISNMGIRYDYFIKKNEPNEYVMMRVYGGSLLLLKFWDIEKNNNNVWYHPIAGVFAGEESENELDEIDYLPGFNYFMEKPSAGNPLLYPGEKKKDLYDFFMGDIFLGIAHGNSYAE
ncbi:hypothetical protein HY745_02215 [Candidatus Desantisbacteria bacterium]|nr:hypothetical protein [Candidatus Desantisbacteria bacterium]